MKGRKIWKKCVAGMLAAAMMMGMTLGVSAAENEEAALNFDATQKGSVTIIKKDNTEAHNPIAGVTFNFAKIGEFVQAENDGSVLLGFSLDEKLTEAITIKTQPLGTTDQGVEYYDGGELQKELQTSENKDALTKLATGVFGTTDAEGTVSKSELDLGLYLFVETKAPAGVAAAHAPFILSVPMTSADETGWVYDITVEPKNDLVDTPVPVKSVEGTTKDKDRDTASVGDVLTYTLKTNIVDAFGTLDKLVLYDNMSKGLTLQKKVDNAYVDADLNAVETDKASIFTVTGTKKDGSEVDLTTDAISVTATTTETGTKLSITFKNPNTIKENYASVSVSYPAKLNKDAAIYDPNTNQVTMDYGTETGIKGNKINVYTYGYALEKVNKKNEKLSGAEFRIFSSEDDAKNRKNPLTFLSEKEKGELVSTATSGADGIVKFYGLEPGTYWIAETKAPDGYNLLKDPVQIEVTRVTGVLTEGQADIQIVNTKGFELPTTGGAGTIVFTLGGIIVMILAVAIYLKSRKKQS